MDGNAGTYNVAIEVTYNSKPKAKTEVKELVAKAAGNSDTELTFDLSNLLIDDKITKIEVVVEVKPAVYTLKAPSIVNGGGVTNMNGLTITAEADKISAKAGEDVTVTVTVQGKVTAATDLDITCSDGVIGTWANDNTDKAGVSGGGTASLEFASTVNFVTPTPFYYTYTASDSGAQPTITMNNG